MNEDLFIKKVIQLEEDVRCIKEVMINKDDLREIIDPVNSALDYLVKITKKMDTELTFLVHRMRENSDKIEIHDRDIAQIKPFVGIV